MRDSYESKGSAKGHSPKKDKEKEKTEKKNPRASVAKKRAPLIEHEKIDPTQDDFFKRKNSSMARTDGDIRELFKELKDEFEKE